MLWICETYVNRTENARYGDSEPYETWTDDLGKLYRSLQREYGRCTGTQWTERKDGTSVKIGWVFEKRARYQDSSETYLQETWITVWRVAPKRVPEHWTGGEYAF